MAPKKLGLRLAVVPHVLQWLTLRKEPNEDKRFRLTGVLTITGSIFHRLFFVSSQKRTLPRTNPKPKGPPPIEWSVEPLQSMARDSGFKEDSAKSAEWRRNTIAAILWIVEPV